VRLLIVVSITIFNAAQRVAKTRHLFSRHIATTAWRISRVSDISGAPFVCWRQRRDVARASGHLDIVSAAAGGRGHACSLMYNAKKHIISYGGRADEHRCVTRQRGGASVNAALRTPRPHLARIARTLRVDVSGRWLHCCIIVILSSHLFTASIKSSAPRQRSLCGSWHLLHRDVLALPP